MLLITLIFLGTSRGASIDKNYPYLENRWFIDVKRFSEGSHGHLSCDKCHNNIVKGERPHPDQESQDFLKKSSIERYDYLTCEKCHSLSGEDSRKGVHAELPMKKKAPLSELARLPKPTCGHCHDTHYDTLRRDRFEVGLRATERCRLCHEKQVDSYLEDVHGRKAYFLKDKKAPFCSDCHSAHQVLSLKDKELALGVCQRCHPKAGPNFVEGVIHKVKKEDLSPGHPKQAGVGVLRVVGTVSFVIVLCIIFFSSFHTLLWLLREIQKALRKRR